MIQIENEPDIHKKKQNSVYGSMNKARSGTCIKKCLEFKAKKPVNMGRYASGQSRCQTCEIYIFSEGVRDNVYCKCCNNRVRSRPRNSIYKEKYFEHVNNTDAETYVQNSNENDDSKNNFNLEKDDPQLGGITERLTREPENIKKESPTYDTVDESVKTFYEFKEFLESEIKLQSNYQLVMLKELMEYGRLHKGDIAESLAYFNNKDSSNLEVVKYYLNVPVFDVLLKREFVKEDGYFKNEKFPYYVVNVSFSENQQYSILESVQEQLDDYNRTHDILENQYPDANNMDSIDWDQAVNIIDKKESPKISNSEPLNVDKSNFDSNQNEILVKENTISPKHGDFFSLEPVSTGTKIEKFQKIDSNLIHKSDIFSNDDVIDMFNIGNMGGIRYTNKHNILVLFSTHSDDYSDSIDSESGLIIYTGEGKDDQELTNGNEKILKSKNNSMVFFREVYQEPGVRKRGALDNKYEFVGIVNYKKHYWKSEKNRKVIKFVLEVVS